jgi:effector-binding domain-containing protein
VVYDVDVVAVAEQAVIALSGPASREEVDRLAHRLRGLATEAGLTPAGPAMARFAGRDPDDASPGCDVCLPVLPSADGVVPDRVAEARGEWVPLHHALEAVHAGPRDTVGDAWRAVFEACAALGYTPAGPLTEVYVTGDATRAGEATGAGGPEPVTRVRLPYAR